MDLPWEVRLLRSPAARSPLSLREGRKKYATVLPERDYTEEELRFRCVSETDSVMASCTNLLLMAFLVWFS